MFLLLNCTHSVDWLHEFHIITHTLSFGIQLYFNNSKAIYEQANPDIHESSCPCQYDRGQFSWLFAKSLLVFCFQICILKIFDHLQMDGFRNRFQELQQFYHEKLKLTENVLHRLMSGSLKKLLRFAEFLHLWLCNIFCSKTFSISCMLLMASNIPHCSRTFNFFRWKLFISWVTTQCHPWKLQNRLNVKWCRTFLDEGLSRC